MFIFLFSQKCITSTSKCCLWNTNKPSKPTHETPSCLVIPNQGKMDSVTLPSHFSLIILIYNLLTAKTNFLPNPSDSSFCSSVMSAHKEPLVYDYLRHLFFLFHSHALFFRILNTTSRVYTTGADLNYPPLDLFVHQLLKLPK